MSLITSLGGKKGDGFPRVSGDEPTAQKHFRRLKQFSPRERG